MTGKKVFHVMRTTQTGKTVHLGDFDTVDEAKTVMIEHYKQTPKRGKFRYWITEDELEEIGGVMMRKTCLAFGNNGPYRKKFDADELKVLAAG